MQFRKSLVTVSLAAVAAVLVGCGEKPQTASGIKSDDPPYAGTGIASFTDRGWESGDKTAWAQHLKSRLQYGQNEYSRPSSASQ